MWLKFAIGAFLALLPATAQAGDAQSRLIACVATRSDAAKVWVDNLRFGLKADYAWASGKVHVLLKNNTVLEYNLNGKATPTQRRLARNAVDASFAYPGFACVVQHQNITSVHNCKGSGKRRTCEVTVEMWGTQFAYSVSLTAERLTPRLAKLP